MPAQAGVHARGGRAGVPVAGVRDHIGRREHVVGGHRHGVEQRVDLGGEVDRVGGVERAGHRRRAHRVAGGAQDRHHALRGLIAKRTGIRRDPHVPTGPSKRPGIGVSQYPHRPSSVTR